MSRSLGPALPPDVLGRLSQADIAQHLGKAIPFITVGDQGLPHPMLLSALEVRAVDAKTIRIVIGAKSRSARNLLERPGAALLIVEPERTVYVKARAVDGPLPVTGLPDFGLFVLTVEDILEDAPAEWEGGIRITTGVTYAPVPSLHEPWVKATVAALAHEPNP